MALEDSNFAQAGFENNFPNLNYGNCEQPELEDTSLGAEEVSPRRVPVIKGTVQRQVTGVESGINR